MDIDNDLIETATSRVWLRLTLLLKDQLPEDGWLTLRDLRRLLQQQSWLKNLDPEKVNPILREALGTLDACGLVELDQANRSDSLRFRRLDEQESPSTRAARIASGWERVGIGGGEVDRERLVDHERVERVDGFVYVLEFSDGTIKPGSTAQLLARFKRHEREARRFKIKINRWWVSPRIEHFLESEQDVLREVRKRTGHNPSEYFAGTNFDEVSALAKAIIGAREADPKAAAVVTLKSRKTLGPASKVQDVVELLDSLEVPTDIGRPAVLDGWIRGRHRVGHANLAAAIAFRKRRALDATV